MVRAVWDLFLFFLALAHQLDSSQAAAGVAAAATANPALFSAVINPLLEALIEVRMEVLRFLQEKAQQTVYVRAPADERGQ